MWGSDGPDQSILFAYRGLESLQCTHQRLIGLHGCDWCSQKQSDLGLFAYAIFSETFVYMEF